MSSLGKSDFPVTQITSLGPSGADIWEVYCILQKTLAIGLIVKTYLASIIKSNIVSVCPRNRSHPNSKTQQTTLTQDGTQFLGSKLF